MVMDNWKLSKLWDIVTLLSGNPEARHEVASAAKICAKAANIGDPVALHIYEKAANELFIQTRMAIEPNRKDWDGTTVIMGGAWKGCPHMLDTFRNLLTEVYPEANVIEPVFEPVAGAVVRRFIREGYSTEYIQNRLQAGFQKLLYQTER